MNRSTVAALVVALMLGSGIAGYLIGKPGDILDRQAPTRTATATPSTPPTASSTPTTPAQGTQAGAPVPISQPAAAPGEPLSYRRTGIDSSKAEGEACLFFNKPLAGDDSVKYGDYVRLTLDVRAAVRPVDDKLCIGGLAYGVDYSVKLMAGLPAISLTE